MPQPLQKARAEDQEICIGVLAEMWGAGRLGSPVQPALQGRRKEQVAGPEGTGVGRLDARGGIPPKTRAQPLESLLSNTPQAVGLPPPVPRAGWLCFQTSPFPWVARSNSFILGEQRVLGDPPQFWALSLFLGVRGGCICPGHAIHSPDVFCAIEAPSFH